MYIEGFVNWEVGGGGGGGESSRCSPLPNTVDFCTRPVKIKIRQVQRQHCGHETSGLVTSQLGFHLVILS